MAKLVNPLLLAVRELGLALPCIRVYTTVRKDGSYRVKFYGIGRQVNSPEYTSRAKLLLEKNGWAIRKAGSDQGSPSGLKIVSATLVATRAAG